MRTKRAGGRMPLILDGTYFEVVSQEGKIIQAKCVTCMNEGEKERIIKGSTDVSSNFNKHLKRHKKAHEEYQLYKQSEKGSEGNGSTMTKQKHVSKSGEETLGDVSRGTHYESEPEDNVDDEFYNEADTMKPRKSGGGVVGGESGSVYRYRRNQNSDKLPEKLKELYMGQMGSLSDVTLFSSDGSCVEAHKVILALCSPYFQRVFKKISQSRHVTGNGGNAAVVVLGNVKTSVLRCLVQFMYTGEAAVKLEEMDEFLKMGEVYQIDGIGTPSAQQKSTSSQNITPVTSTKTTARKKMSAQTTSSRTINVRVVRKEEMLNKASGGGIPRKRKITRDKEESETDEEDDDRVIQCKTELPDIEISSDNEFISVYQSTEDEEVEEDDGDSGDELLTKRRKKDGSSNDSGSQRRRGRPKKSDNPPARQASSNPPVTDTSTFSDHNQLNESEVSAYQQPTTSSAPSCDNAGPSWTLTFQPFGS